MQKNITLRVLPTAAQEEQSIKKAIAQQANIAEEAITGFNILKKSLDARSKTIWVNLSLQVFVNEPFVARRIVPIQLQDVHNARKKVIIIGAGPAGLFAAFALIEQGIKPIILERGKDVRERRRDLALLNKEGIINPESNYCFGEGGAGTYSDGKLYTRSNKRGNINKALSLLVQYGADERILYEAHPHIGTNKLPQIMTAMRTAIIEAGGMYLFNKKVVDFTIKDKYITAVITADGDIFQADKVILATGHSARDIFYLLQQKQISIYSKPFALGVRVEHPQALINQIQYKCNLQAMQAMLLPPASYSLVQQVDNRGVFSFCMCPGGIIATAATSEKELVVNGWSPSKRNNPYANSGMVVQVSQEDAYTYFNGKEAIDDPLLLMKFQQSIEQKAFEAGGGKFVAPAQRMTDFCRKKQSTTLPANSYVPGTKSVLLHEVLPPFVYDTLQEGFKQFSKKMKGYYTEEASIIATESRTSSPVRIPRDNMLLQHPDMLNLYPCGEGAGYAGGIISAAMDGERVALTIAQNW